ncbi:MAG: hypothetical protein OXJ64_00310 [Boseongicola sp.]|nr:hypothetical protein [Boseongicola sp.]
MDRGSLYMLLHCQHFPKDCEEETARGAAPEENAEPAWASRSGDVLEPGQDMFGALSEINRLIEDSGQGWDNVDLDVLWEHLRDMDALMTGAQVVKATLPDGLHMRISGIGDAKRAMDNMLPAHATFLRSARPAWTVSIEDFGASYEITVTSTYPGEARRIQALGFSGFMVQDDHHASHHLGLALGKIVH